MKTRQWTTAMGVLAALWASGAIGAGGEKVTDFSEGKWDKAAWTPVRLPGQAEVLQMEQKADGVGTHAFSAEEIKKGLDNVMLMTDSGLTEGEFETRFRIGPEHGTAPGFFFSPVVEGDALVSGYAIFVADYTMAVWTFSTVPETKKTTYAPVMRLARWQNPAAEHVLRCRFSKRSGKFALRIDDSDVVVLPIAKDEVNSKIGIWGCHGTCDFYSFMVLPGGTLPWSGSPPEAN